jgi:hypothetical protein
MVLIPGECFAGFDAADRGWTNACAGGELGLGPAGGCAGANDLSGEDGADGLDGRVLAPFIGGRQGRQVRIAVIEPGAEPRS